MAVAPIVSSSSSPAVDAAGTPDIALSESAPATILYGTDASVSLTASNPGGGSWGYNLSYEDVLPAGVSYVPGSTSPASVGDPQILANEPATHDTTLIWSNVSDLSPGSSNTLGFSLAAATDADPTPNFLPNEGYTDSTSAYVNADPRYVPQFGTNGVAVNASTSYTGSATSGASTTLSPLAISQTPGGDHLRGVHDHQFVSTITVTNNDVHATNGITVDDWLPAGLEYLLCGQTDNTTDAATNPGSVDEYPGSGPTSGHLSLSSPSPCRIPATVATAATDPDGSGPLPSAVYTHVEWTGLGNLAPSATLTLEFVTAIPIRANTMTWTSGSAPATALGQAANLDNNSGTETTNGEALTIFATATGTYTGTLGSGVNPVEATGYDSVIARDIDTTKAVSDGTFSQDSGVTYTITVNTSEYRYSDGTTVTDTLPSGLCPLGGVNYDAQQASECAPTGAMPSPAYASVPIENADGTFTLGHRHRHLPGGRPDRLPGQRRADQSNRRQRQPDQHRDRLGQPLRPLRQRQPQLHRRDHQLHLSRRAGHGVRRHRERHRHPVGLGADHHRLRLPERGRRPTAGLRHRHLPDRGVGGLPAHLPEGRSHLFPDRRRLSPGNGVQGPDGHRLHPSQHDVRVGVGDGDRRQHGGQPRLRRQLDLGGVELDDGPPGAVGRQ